MMAKKRFSIDKCHTCKRLAHGSRPYTPSIGKVLMVLAVKLSKDLLMTRLFAG